MKPSKGQKDRDSRLREKTYELAVGLLLLLILTPIDFQSKTWEGKMQFEKRTKLVHKAMRRLQNLQGLLKEFLSLIQPIFTEIKNSGRDIRLAESTLKELVSFFEQKSNEGDVQSTGSQGMQNQVHSQGQSIPIPLHGNQPQARQQLLPQNVQNNIASAAVQSSAALQSGTPSVSALSQNPVPNVVGQNSNMQNLSGISQNSLGQGILSNIFANQQRQMQGRQQVLPQQQQQQLYHQQLQHPLIKQEIQQGNLQPSLVQSNMQQQQNMLPTMQLQSSQQPRMPASSVMQPSAAMQSTPLPILQQNQQSSLQQSTQSMLQKHQQSVLRQQQKPQQSASAGIHQQQTPITQQSMMPQPQQPPLQSQQQPQQPQMMGQQINAANIQQNQLIGQQNGIADMQHQRLLGQSSSVPNLQQQQQLQLMAQQNNLSNVNQQQFGPQSTISGLQQQQQLIGTQSGNSSMQTNQQSLHMVPQPKVPLQQTQQSAPNLVPTQGQTSQQLQQQQQHLMSQMQSQSPQLQEQLGLQQQPNQLQPNMQQRLQASGQASSSLVQSQNLMDQRKQLYQSQRVVPETSSINHLLEIQQFQQRQMQQPLHQEAKQQLPTQLQTHQMPQLHQMNDVNDIRQGMGFVKPGAFQHLPAAQCQSYTHQQLKPGGQFPISSPQLLQAASPQMRQHSSPQVDQQSQVMSISETGTPLQSANSPFIVPSPSTPLAPSPMPGEPEKPVRGASSLSNAANVGHQQGTSVQAGSQSLAIGTPGISASPLLAEFACADGTHANALTTDSSKSNIIEHPLERLMKAVESMSPIALAASLSDIGSVVSMSDRIPGSALGNGSRAAVGEDAMTKCCLQPRNFITQDGMSGTKKTRPPNVVSSAGSINDSLKQLTATSSVKRPRFEASHALLREIWEINQRLMYTVVDISDEDVGPGLVAATAEGGEGTIDKCSFSAVALSSDLKSRYMSAPVSPIQPLRLLTLQIIQIVPQSY